MVELGVMALATAVLGIVVGPNDLSDPETVSTDIEVVTPTASLVASFGPAALVGADPATGDESPSVSLPVGSLLAVLAVSITAAIGEETVYRGYGITRRHGSAPGPAR